MQLTQTFMYCLTTHMQDLISSSHWNTFLSQPLFRTGANFNLKADICESNTSAQRSGVGDRRYSHEKLEEKKQGKDQRRRRNVARWPGKKRDFLTLASRFPSGAELLLALPGVKRTVDGRARRATSADRSCACLFMQRNSWGFGESFKDEGGCTSCMAFSSGWVFCIWPLTNGLINPPACYQALDPPSFSRTKRLLFEQILPGVTLSVLHHLKGQAQQMAEKTVLSMTKKKNCSWPPGRTVCCLVDVIGWFDTSQTHPEWLMEETTACINVPHIKCRNMF